jgi:hypothetical protein
MFVATTTGFPLFSNPSGATYRPAGAFGKDVVWLRSRFYKQIAAPQLKPSQTS